MRGCECRTSSKSPPFHLTRLGIRLATNRSKCRIRVVVGIRFSRRRWRLLLRVFGRLPFTDVMRFSEAGVRKASREETAGGVCAGSGVGLWGFSAGACPDLSVSNREERRVITAALGLVAVCRIGTVVLQ